LSNVENTTMDTRTTKAVDRLLTLGIDVPLLLEAMADAEGKVQKAMPDAVVREAASRLADHLNPGLQDAPATLDTEPDESTRINTLMEKGAKLIEQSETLIKKVDADPALAHADDMVLDDDRGTVWEWAYRASRMHLPDALPRLLQKDPFALLAPSVLAEILVMRDLAQTVANYAIFAKMDPDLPEAERHLLSDAPGRLARIGDAIGTVSQVATEIDVNRAHRFHKAEKIRAERKLLIDGGMSADDADDQLSEPHGFPSAEALKKFLWRYGGVKASF
jgi:hypothetical protein